LLVGQIPTQGSLALRALVKVAQGKDAVAIENFRQALAAEEPGETGSSAWTRTLLARFYFKRGNPQQAIALYNETLRVLPKYPLALVNLAELETRLGRYQAAEQHYSQVFVSPAYPNVFDHVALQGLSRIKQLQGDSVAAKDLRDKAENLLRQHLSLNAFGHRRVLARLLLDGGDSADVAEALTLMQAEVKVRRDAETLDTLAWALSRSDRWQEARQVMQEALRWGIRDAAMFYRVGAIEQALGNPTQAIAYFERAQATDPSFNEQARQTLGLGGEIGY
jgi:tetratricopeptide (TPR) repeat protein